MTLSAVLEVESNVYLDAYGSVVTNGPFDTPFTIQALGTAHDGETPVTLADAAGKFVSVDSHGRVVLSSNAGPGATFGLAGSLAYGQQVSLKAPDGRYLTSLYSNGGHQYGQNLPHVNKVTVLADPAYYTLRRQRQQASNLVSTAFLPSQHGFKFANSFSGHGPVATVRLFGASIHVGDISAGLCGGMVYAALDFFLARRPIPADTSSPTQGPLLDYISQRQIESLGPPQMLEAYKYASWLWSKTHETELGGLPFVGGFFGGHGLAYYMLQDEWPRIQQDINAGTPAPLGIVVNKDVMPTNIPLTISALKQCHQLLAYAYEKDAAGNVILHVYDPNVVGVDADHVTLTFSAAPNPDFHTIPLSTPLTSANLGNDTFKGFFHSTAYQRTVPPAGL